MASLVGKTIDLVFYARAIAWPNTIDLAGEHRASVKARANDVVGALIGVGDPTSTLFGVHVSAAHETEDGHQRRLAAQHAVTRLFAALGKIDAAPINAWRGARLQPPLRQAKFFQSGGKSPSGRVTCSTRRIVIQAHMDFSIQKGACC